jgi:hypothetical protein
MIDKKKRLWLNSGNSGGAIDYTVLYASFDKLIIPDSTDSIYSDVARSTLAVDGDYARNLTELIDGSNLPFTVNSPRTFLAQEWGSRYNLRQPVYKKPAGDVGVISFFNSLNNVFQSASFTGLTDPNTIVAVIRSRTAVNYEGGVGLFGGALRDRGDADHYELSNSAGSVELDAASGVAAFDQVAILMMVADGANSQVYLNGTKLGTDETLGAGTISSLLLGTTSHVQEHDVLMVGLINDVLSTGDRGTLQTLLETLWTPTQRPQKPHAYNIVVTFDGTDTFNVTYDFHDADGSGENTSAVEYEWIVYNTIADLDGFDTLDSQAPAGRGATFKRGEHPNKFIFPSGTYGDGHIYVACRVKAYSNNGNSWGGIPFRSLSLIDNVAGTPVTTGQFYPDTISVEDATPDEIQVVLGWTSGGDGWGAGHGGNVADFHVYVNGSEVTISSFDGSTIVASSFFTLNLAAPLLYSDVVTLSYVPIVDDIVNPSGFALEQFYTGVYLPFNNNIVGPITMKVNLSFAGVDGTSPPWANVNSAWTTIQTEDADVADINGDATGISLEVLTAFQGWNTTSGGPGTLFDEANVAARGASVYQAGTDVGVLRFAGLSAGQTFDISYAIGDGNGGAGSVDVTDGAGVNSQAFTDGTYTEYTKTGLTADGSGNVDITLTITGSTKQSTMCGIILTTYP